MDGTSDDILKKARGPAWSETAVDVARGVSRLFIERGYGPLQEFILPNGQRLDVAGVSDAGAIAAVEIKVSLADLRGDRKWGFYLDYCDAFYFAIPPGFPEDAVPDGPGLIVADRFGGAIVRESPITTLNAARRKALMLRFARCAALRVAQGLDPDLTSGWS